MVVQADTQIFHHTPLPSVKVKLERNCFDINFPEESDSLASNDFHPSKYRFSFGRNSVFIVKKV